MAPPPEDPRAPAPPRPAPSLDAGPPWWRQGRVWFVVVALAAGALSIGRTLDRGAQEATDRVFRQALLTYAAARSLDAAVSLAEGTELALEPGGIGVTISAGEILEPLDDLVEQFSSLMLVSTTSLGIQSLLLRASAWGFLTGLLVVVLAARVASLFLSDRIPSRLGTILGKAATLLLLARFAVPAYALGTTWVFERFLQPGQEEAVLALEETSGDVREMERLDAEDVEPGLAGRVSRWFSGALERLDVTERVEALRERVGEAVDHLVHLMVVFVLQTLVLPVAFLWVLSRALTGVTTWRR